MFEVGDAVPLRWTVKNPDRTEKAAADVVLRIDQPDGEVVEPAVTAGEVGEYEAVFVPTQPGRHVVRWSASGDATDAFTDVLNVAEAVQPVALISLDEAREHLNMAPGEHADDEELRTFVLAASKVVEQHLRQTIARRTVVEPRSLAGQTRIVLGTAPVLSLAQVEADLCTPTATLLDPATGLVELDVPVHGPVVFTYEAGYRVVPDEILKATAIITGHLWSTQRTPLVTAGFGDAPTTNPGRGYLIPNQAAQLLGGRGVNLP